MNEARSMQGGIIGILTLWEDVLSSRVHKLEFIYQGSLKLSIMEKINNKRWRCGQVLFSFSFLIFF